MRSDPDLEAGDVLRITICNLCCVRLRDAREYASVPLGAERLDLCYAKCYQHYEQLERDRESLANELGKVAKERNEALVARFRERLMGDELAQIDLGSFNALREEDGNRVQASG